MPMQSRLLNYTACITHSGLSAILSVFAKAISANAQQPIDNIL